MAAARWVYTTMNRTMVSSAGGEFDFDGFCCIRGHNNQPKNGRNYGIYFWETARRAMTIGEAAVASFGPSNYWTKINKKKFVVALGGRY